MSYHQTLLLIMWLSYCGVVLMLTYGWCMWRDAVREPRKGFEAFVEDLDMTAAFIIWPISIPVCCAFYYLRERP